MNMKNKDIIIVSLKPWYLGIKGISHGFATEFARHNRVLFINCSLNRKLLWNRKGMPDIQRHYDIIHGKGGDLVEVQLNLWNYYPHRILESINKIPFTPVFSFFNKINNRRFSKDIREAAARLGFKNYILINDNDIFNGFYLKEFLQPELYVYCCRDNLKTVNYFKKHGAKLEPEHIAKADLALTNSDYLLKYLKQYNINSYNIGLGCDIAHFNPEKEYTIPADMLQIPRPIIGYVGTLTNMRLDIDLLHSIAESRPAWSLVLIGPEDEAFRNSDLHSLPNIYFLGQKNPKEVPAYINAFDIGINPQLVNELTIGNYPLKVDEYLAMGKPVVATQTDGMNMFAQYAYLASKPADYTELIEKALSENNEERIRGRVAFAKTHSWENVVTNVSNHFNSHNIQAPDYKKEQLKEVSAI